MQPVSFVIIEFNNRDEVAACIRSIREHCRDMDYEIIVSSNSCYTATEQEKITVQSDPEIEWIFNSRNLGFAAGMNQGIRNTKGDIFIVMNPDVRLCMSVSDCAGYMRAHPDTGIVGPHIEDSKGNIQDSFRRFMTPFDMFARQVKRLLKRTDVLMTGDADDMQTRAVDWVIGGFMMVSRRAAEDVGFFDEGYFLYVEDMDWCYRFWQSGYRVLYYPELTVIYKGDRKSTAAFSKSSIKLKYMYMHMQSYLRFLRKYRFISYHSPSDNVKR